MQQVDPVNYYKRECLIEYEFDRKLQFLLICFPIFDFEFLLLKNATCQFLANLYGDVIKSNTLRGSPHDYVNFRYPVFLFFNFLFI